MGKDTEPRARSPFERLIKITSRLNDEAQEIYAKLVAKHIAGVDLGDGSSFNEANTTRANQVIYFFYRCLRLKPRKVSSLK